MLTSRGVHFIGPKRCGERLVLGKSIPFLTAKEKDSLTAYKHTISHCITKRFT